MMRFKLEGLGSGVCTCGHDNRLLCGSIPWCDSFRVQELDIQNAREAHEEL